MPRLPLSAMFYIAIILTSLIQPLQASTTVHLSTGHWPPYFNKDEKGGGIITELIAAAYATQGLNVQFTFFPWSRALMLADSGKFDATAAWSCTEMRSDDYLYSLGILPHQSVFYHRKKKAFDWDSLSDLKGMTVGVTQDYSYNQDLNRLQNEGLIQTDVITSDEGNFRKLLAGRIDLFPMDPLTGSVLIQQWLTPQEANQLTFHPKPIKRGFYHVLFSKRNAKSKMLRRRLDAGIQALRESGQFDAIVAEGLERVGLSIDQLNPAPTTNALNGCRSSCFCGKF